MKKLLKRIRKRPTGPDTDYEVGYGKPPKDTRFKVGNPGNLGRRNKGKPDNIPWMAEERVKSIILKEAYRVLKLHDGKTPITISVLETAVRNLGTAAAKGQVRAALNFVDWVRKIEDENRTAYVEYVQAMIDYKESWTEELERRKRHNIDKPDPIPHPDDIIVKLDGTVEIVGPLTREQKRLWDRAPETLKQIDEELAGLADQEKAHPEDRKFLEDERQHLMRVRALVARRVRRQRS